MKQVIHTKAAPLPIGHYSQAIQIGQTIYCSGQIALSPETGEMVVDDVAAETTQIFENIKQVAIAAHGTLAEVVKLTVYVTDPAYFAVVNEVMGRYFQQPYPARTSIVVVALPKGARVEVEALIVLNDTTR